MEIKDLQPQAVFSIFDEITRIPRPSKKEEKIRAYLLDFAEKHGIASKTDAIGNVTPQPRRDGNRGPQPPRHSRSRGCPYRDTSGAHGHGVREQ